MFQPFNGVLVDLTSDRSKLHANVCTSTQRAIGWSPPPNCVAEEFSVPRQWWWGLNIKGFLKNILDFKRIWWSYQYSNKSQEVINKELSSRKLRNDCITFHMTQILGILHSKLLDLISNEITLPSWFHSSGFVCRVKLPSRKLHYAFYI